MTEPITHIDVGYQRQYAHVLGVRPSVLILCGASDGDTISDDRTAIQSSGGYPAACTCAACRDIACIMYGGGHGPVTARAIYRKRRRQI